MKFSPWQEFLDQVSPSAKGAPAAMQVQAIRAAAIRLCQEARVWSHVSQPSDLEAHEARYAFYFPDMQAQVVGINSLRLDGEHLPSVNKMQWPYGDRSKGYPRLWREEEPGFVVLWPCPDRDRIGAVVVHVDLAPSLGSASCPAFILEHYREALKWGALAELANSQGQVWSNVPTALGDYELRFRREIARARIREHQGGAADASISVTPPPYFP